MANLIGHALGQYELRGMVGQEALVTPYRAQHVTTGQTVLLKVLSVDLARYPSFEARFLRAMEAVASLEHPHIVPVVDYGVHGSIPYLVTSQVAGHSLAGWLHSMGALDLTDALNSLDQIAAALDYSHALDVMHGSLTPSSLLVADDGAILVDDFGLAGLFARQATVSGRPLTLIGAPAYAAPEIAFTGHLTPAADVYALGITLFEMLTGERPFKAGKPLAYIWLHAYQPVPSAHALRPELPPVVDGVLRGALAKSPDERTISAGEVAAQLHEAFYEDSEVLVPSWPEDELVGWSERTLLLKGEPRGEVAGAQREIYLEPVAYDTPPWSLIAGAVAAGFLFVVLLLVGIPWLVSSPGPQDTGASTQVASGPETTSGGDSSPPIDSGIVTLTTALPGQSTHNPTLTHVFTYTPPAGDQPTSTANGGLSTAPSGSGLTTLTPLTLTTPPPGTATPVPGTTPTPTRWPTSPATPGAIFTLGIIYPQTPGTSGAAPTQPPSLPPDAILFVRNSTDIFGIAPDGGSVVQLTGSSGRNYHPSWSPDRQRIAFHSNRTGNMEIFVMSVNGSAQNAITDHSASDKHPAWAWSSSLIAFTSTRTGGGDIYTMTGNGENLTRVTDDGAVDQMPVWSPAGGRIVFASNRDGGDFDLFVINANGSGLSQLTVNNLNDTYPSWSPDGTRIAYVSAGNLYVINIAGGEATQLTTWGTVHSVSWSPNGQEIVFSAGGNLWIIGANGGTPRQLTSGSAQDTEPAWAR